MDVSAKASRVAGIVLAAGLSARFGGTRSKLVAELDDEALVRRVVRAALGSRLDKVVVVVGHAAGEIREALSGLDVEFVDNPAYAEGQSTSVRAGLERLAAGAEAALFLPGDQPLVSSRLIDQLISAWERGDRPIVRPRSGDRIGAPILWDRSVFFELVSLTGDVGGRSLLTERNDEVLEVEIDDAMELADVDTAGDLRRLDCRLGLIREPRLI
jgi:molybdenum cofactor cytidylyltransferase